MAQQSATTFAVNTQVKIGNLTVNPEQMVSMTIDQDLDQPDMCAIALTMGTPTLAKTAEKMDIGDPVEVKLGREDQTPVVVFKGEVVGLEPTYGRGEHSQIVVRAFNRLHRLLRGRKSKTFLKQSDADIANAIAGANGLSGNCDSTPVKHEHVYQHNQTDFEFLRLRAARLGFEVVVDDKTLYFRKPQPGRDSGIKLVLEENLLTFAPRLSSAGMVQEVEVRGWDPVRKQEIVGKATAQGSRLGRQSGADKSQKSFGKVVTYNVDQPIFSVEEAKSIAGAHLAEQLMGYITGEGTCIGRPDLKAGMVISISLSAQSGVPSRFDGKYLLVGVAHRLAPPSAGSRGGYSTTFRVRRDAEVAS